MHMRLRFVLVVFVSFAGVASVNRAQAASPHGSAAVLYRASWASGLGAWRHAGGGWSVRQGVLIYSGESASALLAPYRVSRLRFSVVASMRVTGWKQTGVSESYAVGILLRAPGPVDPTSQTAGLVAGVGRGFIGCDGTSSQAVIATADTSFNTIKQESNQMHPGHAWHLYRVDVSGNTISLSIDGRPRVTATSKQFVSSHAVGLFSLSGAMQVRSFQIAQG
jgi:hypothetical protein